MALRVLALAAPQFPEGLPGERALSSADPASLFNACRYAARLAEDGTGPWADSNWADSRDARRESVLLLHDFAGSRDVLRAQVEALRPNLVLIGCMSICLPGAVACAEYIKSLLGDEVCIVLGGRHPSESVYRKGSGPVQHHVSSPLRLMVEGLVPPVFDVVVSGDGEYVITALGDLVSRTEAKGRPAARAKEHLAALAAAPGRWIAGAVEDGRVRTVAGLGGPIDYDRLPAPCALFGVRTAFDVFGGRPTAHVFSDVGRGCIYDCTFCSERRSVTGAPAQLDTSADRLFRQMVSAVRVIEEDYPGVGASAFVEDSTLLTGAPVLVERFIRLLDLAGMDLRFGGQLTIDQILSRPRLIADLKQVGLDYLFIGLETLSPAAIGGMSKDVRRKTASWVDRAEAALELLADNDITCGSAVLFGLGEPHEDRLALVEQVRLWRKRFGFPAPVSMNWATQHPLAGDDGGTNYTYTDWAIPSGPFLEAFRDFGEASVLYPLAGQPAPVLAEVREVHAAIAALPEQPAPKPVLAAV